MEIEHHRHHRSDAATAHPDPPKSWREFSSVIAHPLAKPFYFVDWVCSKIAYRISRWSFLQLLEHAGSFSVLVAVIFWIAETRERMQQRHYQAWQVINTAQGKGGSGGRLDALQQLNEDHVPLVGVDVAGAYLQGIELENAELRRANFSASDMRNAHLGHAKLQDVIFTSANVRGADFRHADLTEATLTDTDLSGADLRNAEVKNALFDKADLRGVDLSDVAGWREIQSIRLANLEGVKNAPEGFLAWAKERGAVQMASTEQWNAALHAAEKPTTMP